MRQNEQLSKDFIPAGVELWSDLKQPGLIVPQSLRQGCNLWHRERATPLQLDIGWLPQISGGATSRMRGSHAVKGNSLKKGPAVMLSQPSRVGTDKFTYYTGMNGDQQGPFGTAIESHETIEMPVIFWLPGNRTNNYY